jgi:hypothetical protein
MCCEALDNTCVADTDPCERQDDWSRLVTPSSPVQPMDDLTVFAVAQLPLAGATDTKGLDRILQVAPDVVLRGWGQWSNQGNERGSYDGGFISTLHQHQPPILFLGGGTASAIFASQFSTGEENVKKLASLNSAGKLVEHAGLNPHEYRGSLANPKFREHLADIGGYQIDAGVDGLVFSEVNADMLGQEQDGGRDGDEGYDDFHLVDFTAYLLAKYPDDAWSRLGLPADNRPLRDLSPLRLATREGRHNFNYRDYLSMGGTQLVADWGTVAVDATRSPADSFADQATPYHYWPALVRDLRERAKSRGRFFISANGIFPGVDFVSYSLYDDDAYPWQRNPHFPFPGGHLDGATSHLADFAAIRDEAALIAPGAPVVLYLDGRWRSYHGSFSTAERRDFWRIYAAEAYASGIFFAFLINPPDVSDGALPSAAEDGTLDLFTSLAAFYRAHADIYHHAMPDPGSVATLSVPDAPVSVSVMRQVGRDGGPGRRIVHLINHDYVAAPDPQAGLRVQEGIQVSLPAAAAPTRVRLATPDGGPASDATAPPDVDVPWAFDGASVTFTLPRLDAYDVVTITD